MPKGEMLPVLSASISAEYYENTSSLEQGEVHEECGVFGVQISDEAKIHFPGYAQQLPYLLLNGLHENQNRGETSAGVVVVHNGQMNEYKDMGLVRGLYSNYVSLVQKNENEGIQNPLVENLQGYGGVGHVRYPTTGVKKKDREKGIENTGPFVSIAADLGSIAVSHNGNVINAERLRLELRQKGYNLTATTDSEVIGAVIADAPGATWEEKIKNGLRMLKGSFSLVMKTTGLGINQEGGLYAARDASGNKPLFLAEFEAGVAFSSETPALAKLAPLQRRFQEVEPGEIVAYDGKQIKKLKFTEKTERKICGLDVMYIENVASQGVDKARRAQGAMLAREYPMEPRKRYIITYLPDSAKIFAEAYQEELCKQLGEFVPMRTSLSKNRYGKLNGDNRGFMLPEQKDRDAMAEENYYTLDWLRELLENEPEGTELIIIEDSIVRGTTLKGAIAQYRKFIGNTQIHLRIAFPPVEHDCYFGVDIAVAQGLIFRELGSKEAVADFLGVTSLEYSTAEQLEASIQKAYGKQQHICKGCITGENSETIYEAPQKVLLQV